MYQGTYIKSPTCKYQINVYFWDERNPQNEISSKSVFAICFLCLRARKKGKERVGKEVAPPPPRHGPLRYRSEPEVMGSRRTKTHPSKNQLNVSTRLCTGDGRAVRKLRHA